MSANTSTALPWRLELTAADIGRSLSTLVTGTTAMGGNTLLLVLIARYKTLRTNDLIYMIACLALCDFFVGLGCFIFGVSSVYLRTVIDYYPSKFECMIYTVLGVFGVQAGQLATLAIAYDRCSAMSSPVQYQLRDHSREAARWVVFILAYSAVATSAMFIGVDLEEKPKVCNAGANITPTWATYWASFSLINGFAIVLLYARGYTQMMRGVQDRQQRAYNSQFEQAIEKQKAVTASITIIIMVYAVCWLLPNIGLLLFGVLQRPKLYGTVSVIAGIGSAVNSSVNVFIYGLKHRQIGAHMRKFWRELNGKAANVHPMSTKLTVQPMSSKRGIP